MFLSKLSISNLISSKSLQCVILIVTLAILLNIIGHKYPKDFEEPLKYQFVAAGAEFFNLIGRFQDFFNLGHPLLLTRLGYHYTLGAFNIRDPDDLIQVIDENVEHTSMRIFRPLNGTKNIMPTILFYHGGGHFLGSADIIEPITYLTAKYTNFQVIYVEFRLIPEHKFPAALTDSLLVTKHLINHSNKYKIDMKNLILMGDSAGGNLATVIGQKLISENIAYPKLQVLIYPLLQFFDFTLPSYKDNLPHRVFGSIYPENFKNFLHYLTGIPVDDSVFFNGHTSGLQKESCLSQYVNRNLLPEKFKKNNHRSEFSLMNDTSGKYEKLSEILLNKDLSPLLVDNEYLLKNTPLNTYIVTAEMDILRDDGFIYAERLKRIGMNVHHKHHEDMFHGVLNMIHGPLELTRARILLKEITSVIRNVIINIEN